LTDLRRHCDVAFSRINLLAIDDLSTLKAFCLYIVRFSPFIIYSPWVPRLLLTLLK
jgi:hypothetical protein